MQKKNINCDWEKFTKNQSNKFDDVSTLFSVKMVESKKQNIKENQFNFCNKRINKQQQQRKKKQQQIWQ